MFPMALFQILIVLIVVGLILWGISQIPMDRSHHCLIRVVVIVFVAIWLIYTLFGMAGSMSTVPIFHR